MEFLRIRERPTLRRMNCILTLIACSALAPMSPAQMRASPDLPYLGGVSGTATQVCVGQFTDDTIADGVLLCGGRLILLYAPERFNTHLQIDNISTYASVTKVPLTSPAGHDTLVASSSAGLVLFQWDPTNRVFNSSVVTGSFRWVSATQLQTVSVGSTTKICGVSSLGTSIVYADWNGTSVINTSFTTVSNPILTLAGVNWANELDFAYDDGSGLHIVNATTTLYTFFNACTQPLLLRMPTGPSSTDNVIWVTHDPVGGHQLMSVVRSSGGPQGYEHFWSEAPNYFATTFGAAMVAARLTLADVDGDQSQDLVITRSDDHYAQVLYRQSGSTSFVSSSSNPNMPSNLQINLTNVYGSCTTTPPAVGAGDLDGDGDEDLLFGGHSPCGAEAFVSFSAGVDEETWSGVDETQHIKPWIHRSCYTDWYNGLPASMSIDPWDWSAMAPVQDDATDVHVTVWGLDTSGAIRPQSLVDTFLPYPLGLTPKVYIPPNYSGGPPQYLFMCFNYVRRVGNVITHSYPTWIGKLDRFNTPICDPGDAGASLTGGINRPPPPPSPSLPTP